MKKKSIFVLIISVMLAVIMVAMPPMQVAAAQTQNYVEYISEIKIGVGRTESRAQIHHAHRFDYDRRDGRRGVQGR